VKARIFTFPVRPQDPRRRQVTGWSGGKRLRIDLECGHSVVRQMIGDPPSHMICDQCPAAGGLRISR
jgi:hypothetical protein